MHYVVWGIHTLNIYKSYFFRSAFLQVLKRLEWKNVASLTEDGHKYTQYIGRLRDILEKHGITFIIKSEFQRDAKNVTTVC